VRPYAGSPWAARRGVIHLAVGIHGVPVNLDPAVYTALGRGALAGYWSFGLDGRDTYYYRRVILGAVRAGDFLLGLPQADARGYGVYGSSQGGALAIITAALDPRVTRLSAIHPALSDHEAFLRGRAGGWPHLFAEWNRAAHAKPDKIATARYYDVANFARLVRVPGWYSWGFNDTVCPPTSTYAAYNVIAAPKTLFPVPETAHWTYPEQWERAFGTLVESFPPRR
jgi:cephalosporin-C deacetylase-like acetyl esterase